MQAKTEHLAPTAAQAFLDALPDKIKRALVTYAEEIDYPVEAVLEIAIAGFLDPDSISFADCQPLTGAERDFGRLAS
jgi:predicted transcriptional regulator